MEGNAGKILIVDDNKDIHEDIRYILDSSVTSAEYLETMSLKNELFGVDRTDDAHAEIFDIKYKINDAYQGEEAINMVKQAQDEGNPYSLVFMDVRMPPGMDGIKAIEEIWKIEPSTEVVICTAYSDYSWDQIISKLGQNDHLLFIKKPFDSASVKQIALSMTTKCNLQRQISTHIANLESEVQNRTQELRGLVDQLTTEISLRKEKEKELAYLAHYDALTSLLNRHSFYSTLSSLINEPSIINEESKHEKSFSLFFMDIDNFKGVNDILGHDVGDRLLVEVSKRIRDVLDNHTLEFAEFVEGENFSKTIFRLGGDEFTAIIKESDKDEVGRIASLFIDAIREPYIIQNHEITISCSIGISRYPIDSNMPDVLLKHADVALYKAKKSNCAYAFCEGSEDSDFLNELKLENDLKNALVKVQIGLHLRKGDIC
jgi:diguanylate cyclase (GGDEF)-like protein